MYKKLNHIFKISAIWDILACIVQTRKYMYNLSEQEIKSNFENICNLGHLSLYSTYYMYNICVICLSKK